MNDPEVMEAYEAYIKAIEKNNSFLVDIILQLEKENAKLRKAEKVMDSLGGVFLVIAGLLAVLVIIVQIGKKFYGW